MATAIQKITLSPSRDIHKLLDIYAGDGTTLEQLMAFTVTNDHARQDQVWDAIQRSYSKKPYLIRRQLTESAVRASDRRAQYIGLETYEAAGGVIMRDLFQHDDGGWLEDVALLDRLAIEKLASEAEKIAAEGWKWIEAAIDFPYGHAHRLRELDGVPADLTAEEQATIDALNAEYAKLETEYEGADELPNEVDARLGEIETALAVFENRPVRYDPAEIARAGVFVSIDSDGGLAVDRGHVRPEDEAPPAVDGEGKAEPESDRPDGATPSTPAMHRAVITIGGAEPEEDEDDAIKPLPDRLVSELTAHRTLALRDAVANNPHVAMTALLHKFCLDTFQHSASGACLEASVRHVFFPVQAMDLKDSPSAKAVAKATRPGKPPCRTTKPRSGTGSPRSTRPAAPRFWRIECPSASTPSMRRAIAMAVPASPSTASSTGSARPTGSPVPSVSIWWRPAGGLRSTAISAASPRPASSKRCAKRRASSRRSSLTTSRRATW
jgi:ParB family chromosome partitioning protein